MAEVIKDNALVSTMTHLYTVTGFDTSTEATQTVFQFDCPEALPLKAIFMSNEATTLHTAGTGTVSIQFLPVPPSVSFTAQDGWQYPGEYQLLQANDGSLSTANLAASSGAITLDTSLFDNAQHRMFRFHATTANEPENTMPCYAIRFVYTHNASDNGVYNWSFHAHFDI